MADFTEELEPLFDYSRVQPLNVISLDDDDDDDDEASASPPSKKRKKASNPAVETVDDSVKVTVIEDDDEDWLLPPPKVTKKLGDDSILKALRLQKQELASAESAENVVRAVEESVRQELLSSLQSSPDATAAPHPKPQVERNKVVISIQDKDGVKQFRIYMDDKFERLFKMYADKAKIDIQSLVFSFDGDKIGPDATPESLRMEDDDMIEVHDTSNKKRCFFNQGNSMTLFSRGKDTRECSHMLLFDC
ncbi:uncharacterized protein LOC112201158 isoform X3 [Rosa chinensis]|uniref:uncharacterized protein LOC112201158 isoform X3 n=1 Tax=Rosa chinensis TaxID=74649 RepID=UPI001AD8D9F0|nr:uncharacterized protein LOC112201158 isoform X3 [Rosa chinensis]